MKQVNDKLQKVVYRTMNEVVAKSESQMKIYDFVTTVTQVATRIRARIFIEINHKKAEVNEAKNNVTG